MSKRRSRAFADSTNQGHERNVKPRRSTLGNRPPRPSLGPAQRSSSQPTNSSSSSGSSSSSSNSQKRSSLGARRQSSVSTLSAPDRRQSISSRRGSRLGGGSDDPRQLGDRNGWQKEATNQIITFLAENRYDGQMSPKILKQTRDFKAVCSWLFQRLDPTFTLEPTEDQVKQGWKVVDKWEEEMLAWFKNLGYPFRLSKNMLQTIGTQHSWPNQLGALHWLMQLVDSINEVDPDSVDVDDEVDDMEDRRIYHRLVHHYNMFLEGAEDTTFEAEIRETFAGEKERMERDIEAWNEANRDLESELATQEAAFNLPELQRARLAKVQDERKFQDLCDSLASHRKETEKTVRDKQDDVKGKQAQIAQYAASKDELAESLASQELSPHDVQRMRQHQKQLKDSLDNLQQKRKALDDQKWQLEQRAQDLIKQVELESASFNRVARDLQLIPHDAKFANGDDFTLRVESDKLKTPQCIELSQMANLDLKSDVKPRLIHLLDGFKRKVHTLNGQVRRSREMNEQVEDQRNQKREDVELLEQQLTKAQESYTSDREKFKKHIQSLVGEIKQHENVVRNLQTDNLSKAQRTAETLRTCKKDLEERLKLHAETKESVSSCIMQSLGTLVEHRNAITAALENLTLNKDLLI